jgi:RimJ/RimL family protein N-acetyltransferase
MPRPALPLVTDRLLLRQVGVDDAEAIQSYRSDPDVHRYMHHGELSVDEWRERIAATWTGIDLDKDDDVLELGIVERETGLIVGDVVLFLRSVEHRGGELGYALHPRVQGRGYATEAARAVLRFGFDEVGMHRVYGRIDARNTASARVLERLGMRREAHSVSNEYIKGEWTDEVVYALLEDEWRAASLPVDPATPDLP